MAESAADAADVAGPKIADGARWAGDSAVEGAKAAAPAIAAAGKYAYENPETVASGLAALAAAAAVTPGGQPLAVGLAATAGAVKMFDEAKNGKLETPKAAGRKAADSTTAASKPTK